jgi:hypothetical protein
VVRSDTAGCHEDRPSGELELPNGVAVRGNAPRLVVLSEPGAAHAGDGASGEDELINTVAMEERERAASRRLYGGTGEWLDHTRAGAPSDVETRDRVPVTARPEVAPLSPANGREELDPVTAQPSSLLPGGPLDVGPGPLGGPRVLVVESIELRAALPVAPCQLERVFNT